MSGPTYDDRKLSFGAAADEYGRYRPGYPRNGLEWLFAAARRPVHDVADVGAGTGALTATLVDLGFSVTAVEPDEGMRATFHARLPHVTCREGRGERTGLAAGSVDALTVAQAFHWFDREAAAAEFRRVVRPGGVLGLIWNQRDDTSGWLKELRPLIEDPMEHGDGDETLPHLEALFPGVERRLFTNVVVMTPDDVVGLVNTFSYVRLHREREVMIEAVRELLAKHPDTRGREVVELAYVTEVNRAVL